MVGGGGGDLRSRTADAGSWLWSAACVVSGHAGRGRFLDRRRGSWHAVCPTCSVSGHPTGGRAVDPDSASPVLALPDVYAASGAVRADVAALVGHSVTVTESSREESVTHAPPGRRPRERARGRRKRAGRRALPIHAYVGPNGGGKSLAMVYDTLPTLDAGRLVLSTVRLLDAAGDDHPCYRPLDDYRELLTAEHCDVLMDEVVGVASSRESAGMPTQVANLLVQLRRRDVVLRWTAPSWARADKIIREVSQAVTLCQGFLPKAVADSGSERLWRPRRAFYWRTYDASQFDEFTTHKKNTIRPLVRQVFWRPGSRAESAYDTLDAVLALGVATEAGLCMTCGGKRLHPKCSCPPSTLDLTDTLSALSADAAVSPAPAVALSRRKREARGGSA